MVIRAVLSVLQAFSSMAILSNVLCRLKRRILCERNIYVVYLLLSKATVVPNMAYVFGEAEDVVFVPNCWLACTKDDQTKAKLLTKMLIR